MGLGNAERRRPKKRFSERNSQALRITHFLNPDKGFLKLAQRPHSAISFLRVGINLLLALRTGSLWKGRKHTQRQPVCHTTNITLVQERGQAHGDLSLESSFNSVTDCILELLSHITCQHSHLPAGMCRGRWHL